MARSQRSSSHATGPRRIGRWSLVLALCLPLVGRDAWCETTVPLDLQADLVRKVLHFERGFAGRAAGGIRIVLVVRTGNADSEREAVQLGRSLGRLREGDGAVPKVITLRYTSAAALRQEVLRAEAQLVYFAAGFESEAGNIAGALRHVPVITISTEGDLVDHGIVLGFELVSARPKIALNIGQAKSQDLDFNSDLFRLARVVR